MNSLDQELSKLIPTQELIVVQELIALHNIFARIFNLYFHINVTMTFKDLQFDFACVRDDATTNIENLITVELGYGYNVC